MVVRVTCSKFFFMAKGLKFVVFEKKKRRKNRKKNCEKRGGKREKKEEKN